MTTPPLWPAAFPLWPHVDSVSGGIQPSHASFEPRSGLPIERPSATAEVEVWQVTFPAVTAAQMEAWRTFYATDLARGTRRFGWVHPLREVLREVMIAKGEGSPSWQYVPGAYWRLRLNVQFVDLTPSWAADVSIVNDTLVAA